MNVTRCVDRIGLLVSETVPTMLDAVAPGGTHPPSGAATVTLTTFHGAKGLEWPLVVLPGLEAMSVPHPMAASIAEERRLAFVAVTRARRMLVLSWTRRRAGRPREPSPFLGELAGPNGVLVEPLTPAA